MTTEELQQALTEYQAAMLRALELHARIMAHFMGSALPQPAQPQP
jgi:hypothetical protein